jgi:hypothetical protein
VHVFSLKARVATARRLEPKMSALSQASHHAVARRIVRAPRRARRTSGPPTAGHEVLLVAALVAVGLLAPASAAGASEPGPVSTSYVLERTTAGPAGFDITFQVAASGSPGGDRAPTRLGIVGLVDRADDVPQPAPVAMVSQ